MSKIDWKQIDDYLFVKLVGELLARLGFVDIDQQGDGPDGGIDLFATELLPFAVQGRIPFRWAIQCKFSVKGTEASVNDSEVRDVEGILRCDRYAAQDSRGYMLVTNRKIVQNVIERLRGIDRRSSFRTARIDGSHLEGLLSEHPRLLERYLGKEKFGPSGLGKPDVIISPKDGSNSFDPPSIFVHVRPLRGDKMPPAKVRAIIDTGASMTLIPQALVRALGLHGVSNVRIATPMGQHDVKVYAVRVGIERLGYFPLSVVASEMDSVLLGRDILSKFSVYIRPDGGMSFYKK